MPCPVCRDAVEFEYYNVASTGRFKCPTCGLASAERTDLQVDSVDFSGSRIAIGGSIYDITYTEPFFLYNYALCAAIVRELGVEPAVVKQAWKSFHNIGGRMESFEYAGKRVHYIRMKQENPETHQCVIDRIAAADGRKALAFGLDIIDDVPPGYSDTCYAYDCNFEVLARGGDVEKCICFGSVVAYDNAVRMRYAGLGADLIEIVPSDDCGELLEAMTRCTADDVYLITLLYKFEALEKKAAEIAARRPQ
jgi:UDP-N-acetylmuramoyl-L-alanyl-D-glutamate--2,6-diaminopimelate ligase